MQVVTKSNVKQTNKRLSSVRRLSGRVAEQTNLKTTPPRKNRTIKDVAIFDAEQGGFENCEVRLYRAYANKQFSKQRSYTPKRYVVFILQMLIYYIYITIKT